MEQFFNYLVKIREQHEMGLLFDQSSLEPLSKTAVALATFKHSGKVHLLKDILKI